MHRVDDRNFLNRLSDQRLRKSTQIRQCEAASSRGQLKQAFVQASDFEEARVRGRVVTRPIETGCTSF